MREVEVFPAVEDRAHTTKVRFLGLLQDFEFLPKENVKVFALRVQRCTCGRQPGNTDAHRKRGPHIPFYS